MLSDREFDHDAAAPTKKGPREVLMANLGWPAKRDDEPGHVRPASRTLDPLESLGGAALESALIELPSNRDQPRVAGFDIGQSVNLETLHHASGEAAESLCKLEHGVAIIPWMRISGRPFSPSGRKSSLSDITRFRL